jgi:exopolysaccharide production protein ExoQ
MNAQGLSILIRKIETGLTIFVILYFASINIPEEYRLIAQLFSLIVYGFVIVVTVSGWKRIGYALVKDPLMTGFVALACVSIVWSANPGATWDQTKFLLRATFFGIYLATRYSTKELLQILSWAMGIAVFSSFALGILMPGATTHLNGAWKGAFTHKQSLGSVMGFASSIYLYQWLSGNFNQKKTAFVMYVLAFILIVLSISQTGFMIFLFSLLILPLYKINKQRKHRGVIMIGTLLIFCGIAAALIFNLEVIVTQGFGKNLEFNGRLPVWLIAIARGLERPWYGYGFYGFWSADVSDIVLQNVHWVYNDTAFRTRGTLFHSHNGFIELFLQLGLLGLAWWGISFSICMKKMVSLVLTTRMPEYFWMFQFMGIMLIGNLSESWGILTPSLFWAIYVTISFSSAIQYDRLQKSNHTAPLNQLSTVT